MAKTRNDDGETWNSRPEKSSFRFRKDEKRCELRVRNTDRKEPIGKSSDRLRHKGTLLLEDRLERIRSQFRPWRKRLTEDAVPMRFTEHKLDRIRQLNLKKRLPMKRLLCEDHIKRSQIRPRQKRLDEDAVPKRFNNHKLDRLRDQLTRKKGLPRKTLLSEGDFERSQFRPRRKRPNEDTVPTRFTEREPDRIGRLDRNKGLPRKRSLREDRFERIQVSPLRKKPEKDSVSTRFAEHEPDRFDQRNLEKGLLRKRSLREDHFEHSQVSSRRKKPENDSVTTRFSDHEPDRIRDQLNRKKGQPSKRLLPEDHFEWSQVSPQRKRLKEDTVPTRFNEREPDRIGRLDRNKGLPRKRSLREDHFERIHVKPRRKRPNEDTVSTRFAEHEPDRFDQRNLEKGLLRKRSLREDRFERIQVSPLRKRPEEDSVSTRFSDHEPDRNRDQLNRKKGLPSKRLLPEDHFERSQVSPQRKRLKEDTVTVTVTERDPDRIGRLDRKKGLPSQKRRNKDAVSTRFTDHESLEDRFERSQFRPRRKRTDEDAVPMRFDEHEPDRIPEQLTRKKGLPSQMLPSEDDFERKKPNRDAVPTLSIEQLLKRIRDRWKLKKVPAWKRFLPQSVAIPSYGPCSVDILRLARTTELEALEHLPDRVLMFNKRDPVSVLMEYGQTREVKVGFTDVSRSGPHHASRFHTAATVDGETYALATGTSKKCAKKAAAIITLRTLYDRGMANIGQANVNVNLEMSEMDATEPMAHSSKIMHASRRLLDVAEETQFINYSKDKVLATIVLERRGKYTVAGLGTGNRCIQYQHMTTDGSRIIHSHAEVIARRAFIRYILKELIKYKASEKHPLFTRSRHSGLIKFHDDVKVHLYISRPPCGDAAAFPTITNFPNRMRAIRKQGQLRTIIDDGEGAIPTDFPLPANANGKERLRVMTCSDKILRWNGVGIQGALLSNFMDPIYLNSLVIGSHTGDQRGHVPRAISGRLKCGRLHEVLSKPYRVCSPEIVYPPCSDNYAITKSKQYCITWSEGDPDAEVIDAVTGAVAMEPTWDSPSSRVSKRSLLGLFRAACDNLNAGHLAALSYSEAKQAARTYQLNKGAVEDHLLSCGFGQWLSLQDSYGTDNFQEHEKM